jgi:hypothetical protein
VVPPVYAANWAAQHPEARLRLLESDHQLLNVLDEMWMETEAFLLGSRL